MKFIDYFKQASNGDLVGYRYEIESKPIICPHCNGDVFDCGEAQLNTSGLTLLGLDFLNRSVYALVCSRCGRIEWFARQPERR